MTTPKVPLLVRAGTFIGGSILGSKIADKALDPATKKALKKKKEKLQKKWEKENQKDIKEAPIVRIKRIDPLDVYKKASFYTSKGKEVKNIISPKYIPYDDNEEIENKKERKESIATPFKVAGKWIKQNPKKAAKALGGSTLTMAGWSAMDKASRVAGYEKEQELARKRLKAKQDQEKEKKEHTLVSNIKVIPIKEFKIDKKLAKKVAIAVPFAVASDIAGELGADYIRKKHEEKKKKEKKNKK